MFFLSWENFGQYVTQYLLSGFDIKDSSAPTLNIAPDSKDSYISIAASTQNVIVGVQHLDGATAQARLLVFDQYNLATALKTIPLKRAVATVCVWPDGSRAFVVDPDQDNPAAFAIDVKAGQITKTVTVAANPWGAALSANTKRLLVAGQDTFTVIDTDSFTILGTVPLPRYCANVAVSPDGTEAVALSSQIVDPTPSSNTATVIDVQNRRVTGTFQLDFNPTSAIFTPDNVHALLTRPDTNIFTLRRMPAKAVPPS
jgi:DNA-binding beta-propeller fold protein YncE